MKFIIKRTSDWDYREEMEINTLEELISFRETHGCIILGKDPFKNHEWIEIYDDYRE